MLFLLLIDSAITTTTTTIDDGTTLQERRFQKREQSTISGAASSSSKSIPLLTSNRDNNELEVGLFGQSFIDSHICYCRGRLDVPNPVGRHSRMFDHRMHRVDQTGIDHNDRLDVPNPVGRHSRMFDHRMHRVDQTGIDHNDRQDVPNPVRRHSSRFDRSLLQSELHQRRPWRHQHVDCHDDNTLRHRTLVQAEGWRLIPSPITLLILSSVSTIVFTGGDERLRFSVIMLLDDLRTRDASSNVFCNNRQTTTTEILCGYNVLGCSTWPNFRRKLHKRE